MQIYGIKNKINKICNLPNSQKSKQLQINFIKIIKIYKKSYLQQQ